MAAKTTSATGTKGPSVAELKQFYDKNAKWVEYAQNAREAIQLINPQKTENRTYTAFSKELLRRYIKNPASYYLNIIELSRYLYTRSNPYRKIIHYNASMIDVNYRSIIPVMDMNKEISEEKILKDYWNMCKLMNRSNLRTEIEKMLIISWREDTCFGCWYADADGVFILPLPYNYCKVDTVYVDGTLGFAMNMSFFDSKAEQLEFYGEPFTQMYKDYQKDITNGKWQHMPDEHAFCLKVNIDDPTLPFVPYATLFNNIIDLLDTADVQAVKDQAAVYKLLNFELKPKGEEPDDFIVDPDTAIEYYNKACDSLPPYIAAIVSPVPVSEISFPETQAQDVNLIEKTTRSLFNLSGGAQLLNSASISTTIGWTSALIADEEYGTSILRPQLENVINRLIRCEIKTNCRIKLLPVSAYTKSNYKDKLEKDFQYGEPLKLTLNTLNGFSEIETVSMAKLEQMLQLYDLFIPPKSANTQRSEEGRPSIDNPSDLSDEGDSSRDK